MVIPVQRPFLGEEESNAVTQVFKTRWLGSGTRVEEFESALQEIIGVQNVITVNNGTSALHLALDVILKPGDQVIVPSLTYVATIQPIIQAGAVPIFAEIREDTLNLDPEDVSARITPRTRALLPVHFGGLACDMDALQDVIGASGEKIWIVDDAAHAFGSSYKGRKVGTLGDLCCFSFDPIKNITCIDGGAIATSHTELADLMRKKRVLGVDQSSGRYEVTGTGYRYHLSDVNAAIGLVQLTRMNDFKKRKQQIVERYDEAFDILEKKDFLRLILHSGETFPFFYVVRISNGKRDEFRSFLGDRGVATGLHYYPNHLHGFFGSRTSLPTTERVYRELVTLPLYYEMSDADIERVIAATYAFFGQKR